MIFRDKDGNVIADVTIPRDEFREDDGVTLKLGAALDNIRIELADDYLYGRVRPFVEGEPIGAIRNQKRGPAPMLKSEKELYEERQKVLLELRQKNDDAITRVIGPEWCTCNDNHECEGHRA